MMKKKILKVITAVACVASLILPHTSIVLAAALTNKEPNDTNTVNLVSSQFHEGGPESSESLPDDDDLYEYDERQYKYTFGGNGGTDILKVVREDDKSSAGAFEFSDAFYCLNGEKSFPTINGAITYNRTIPDFFAEKLTGLTDENYNSLCWLLNNMYLRKQMTAEQRAEQKDALIKAAFASELNSAYEDGTTINDIKARITDDDIEVIQQWAIWYFANPNKETMNDVKVEENKLPVIDLTYLKPSAPNELVTDSMDSIDGTRYNWLTALYRYLVKTAEENKDKQFTTSSSHPTITANNASIVEDGDNYKAGPFRVNVPTSCTDEYQVSVTDGNNVISNYTINGNGTSVPPNSDFYIYVPKSSNVNKVKLDLTYFATKASVWTAENDTYQPMVLVTREATPQSVEAILNRKPDLALRKYIVKVNNNEITDRTPDIKLQNGQISYNHKKEPIEIAQGDLVTYQLTVYNEGNVVGKATQIVDYLPEGLEFVADNETNEKYGWQVEGNKATTNYTENTELKAFTGASIDNTSVEIVCKVTNGTAGNILTNIAEIAQDNIDDIDSTPGTITSGVNSDYKGNNSNKSDLKDSNYYYKGQEDDDDFEKVKVAGRAFDLSLQKFITKVNGKAVESREPKVDTTPLKNSATEAKFETVKTPVLVQPGDIVTYTIRVYNEGEVDGYAESVADYLPSGLGYLVNYKDNIDNLWAIPENAGAQTVKLSEISNGTKNLKADDFTGVTDLKNVDVVKGDVKITSTALSSSNSNNLIKAFDGSDKLAYKDIEVTCVVLGDNGLTNTAEITANKDADKNDVTDRDSTPDNKKDGEDDIDTETLTMKNFDLALQKFITGLNDKEITNRVPTVSYNDGKITYKHPEEALEVSNGDNVTYTIRVYNEGAVDGYAAEIGDDIPNGLVFDVNHETNKKYGWKMIDSSGNETTDSSKAVEIRTNYLSKEASEARNENALLTAFDAEKGNLSYLDVKAVFKVDAKSSNDTIINTAEITKDTDSDGNEIEDIDSTPDNKKEDEDDIDKEKIHLGYFDLALQKDLTKAIVTEGNSTKEIPAVNGQLMKVEIHRKKINSTIVKFAYNITITNEGTIAGYAKEIKDYIPEGLQFVQEDNQNWKVSSDGVITTESLADKLLQPGESATVQVVLRWINNENNLGMKTNVAEISKDYNDAGDVDDIDSTPDNKVDGEDDIDDAPVMLSISTGRAPMYIILTTSVLTIISTGVAMIKKYVL